MVYRPATDSALTHMFAGSSPWSVALGQLTSPRACSVEAIIWYTGFHNTQGLETQKLTLIAGVSKAANWSGDWRGLLESKTVAAARLPLALRPTLGVARSSSH